MSAQQRVQHEEKAVLIGVITRDQGADKSREYLEELDFLCRTAGAVVRGRFTQRLPYPDPKTFIGSGKLNQVLDFVESQQIDMAVFDDELSPSQFRNIERILKIKILDRTNLILDIFAQRARTSYARTQVSLAQYQCLLPHLTRMWTHLERQRGGIGMRGPGETEIETDRRIIRDKIALLKEKLAAIDKQMTVQRKNRGKLVRVALVGYTNVGKSTLMNTLAKAEVFAKDELFATLDTTVRKVVEKNLPFLLTDTVGFIRKLPTQLIESFKSTLDEVREADLLVHIVDISHRDFERHMASVQTTLAEINSADKPVILVFNKIDAYSYVKRDPHDLSPITPENYSLSDWKRTWMGRLQVPVAFISAREKQHIDTLRTLLYQQVKKIHSSRFPYDDFLFEYYDEQGKPERS